MKNMFFYSLPIFRRIGGRGGSVSAGPSSLPNIEAGKERLSGDRSEHAQTLIADRKEMLAFAKENLSGKHKKEHLKYMRDITQFYRLESGKVRSSSLTSEKLSKLKDAYRKKAREIKKEIREVKEALEIRETLNKILKSEGTKVMKYFVNMRKKDQTLMRAASTAEVLIVSGAYVQRWLKANKAALEKVKDVKSLRLLETQFGSSVKGHGAKAPVFEHLDAIKQEIETEVIEKWKSGLDNKELWRDVYRDKEWMEKYLGKLAKKHFQDEEKQGGWGFVDFDNPAEILEDIHSRKFEVDDDFDWTSEDSADYIKYVLSDGAIPPPMPDLRMRGEGPTVVEAGIFPDKLKKHVDQKEALNQVAIRREQFRGTCDANMHQNLLWHADMPTKANTASMTLLKDSADFAKVSFNTKTNGFKVAVKFKGLTIGEQTGTGKNPEAAGVVAGKAIKSFYEKFEKAEGQFDQIAAFTSSLNEAGTRNKVTFGLSKETTLKAFLDGKGKKYSFDVGHDGANKGKLSFSEKKVTFATVAKPVQTLDLTALRTSPIKMTEKIESLIVLPKIDNLTIDDNGNLFVEGSAIDHKPVKIKLPKYRASLLQGLKYETSEMGSLKGYDKIISDRLGDVIVAAFNKVNPPALGRAVLEKVRESDNMDKWQEKLLKVKKSEKFKLKVVGTASLDGSYNGNLNVARKRAKAAVAKLKRDNPKLQDRFILIPTPEVLDASGNMIRGAGKVGQAWKSLAEKWSKKFKQKVSPKQMQALVRKYNNNPGAIKVAGGIQFLNNAIKQNRGVHVEVELPKTARKDFTVTFNNKIA